MTASPQAPAAPEIAQLLADLRPLDVVRVAHGVSTWVYRVVLADRIAYLRVLPEGAAASGRKSWRISGSPPQGRASHRCSTGSIANRGLALRRC